MDLIEQYHFYINLEERKQKNKKTIDELKRFGISNPNRFHAIKHEIGLVGCVKSHIKCIELAKQRNYPFVCIFEDDIIFRDIDKCKEKIDKYINYDYDVLYLGAWVRNNFYEFIEADLIKVDYANCNHAYIVKSHYYDTLLENLYEGLSLKLKDKDNYLYNNDEYIVHLQKKDKWYCFYPHFVSQLDGYSDDFKEDRNLYETIFKIPIHYSKLPSISILTPTFNRKMFLPLMINNINNFNYPKEKIEWNILDSNDKNIINYERLLDENEIKYYENKLNIKINYTFVDKSMNIGEKRNILSKNSNYDYLINMDDDDIYFSDYLIHSINKLIDNNKDVVGCLDMLFIYPENNYKTSYIKCVDDFTLYHESTLCMKKTHWFKNKYKETSIGEGCTIWGNNKDLCDKTEIINCGICTCWKNNTVNKDQFSNNEVLLNITGNHLNILKNIFDEINKMNEERKIEENLEKIEITKELLQNIRNLIEVTNDRIKWKTEELLPVGIMIKQIDELLIQKN